MEFNRRHQQQLSGLLKVYSIIIVTSFVVTTGAHELHHNGGELSRERQLLVLDSSANNHHHHHQARPTQFAQSSYAPLLSSGQFDTLAHPIRQFNNREQYENESPPMLASIAANHHGHSIVMPANNNNNNQLGLQQLDTRSSDTIGAQLKLQRHTVREHQHMSTSTESGGFLSASSLEQALRQATGDESVFQPSPGAINMPGHMGSALDDWPAPVTKFGPRVELPSATTTTTTTTTTAPPSTAFGNIVLNHESGSQEPAFLSGKQSMTREYLTSAGMLNISNNNNNNNLDLSNQVIYEGPATAEPPVGDSYYFSATENENRASNNYNSIEKYSSSSNGWWAIGIGQHFEQACNLTRDNHLDYCDKSPLLINNKQRSLCRQHPKIMAVVARGLKLAIDECQSRFVSNRWNCSLILEKAIHQQDNERFGAQIFGDVMRNPNRERSYLNAIIAAGLAHAMTKACSAGELPEECSCDKKIRSKSNKGRVEWIACSDDIDYGARFSRDFTDNLDSNEPDTTATIYLHNNEVGRRVFKSATEITCTCQNGDNGLCQTKRCWKHLGPFTDVGDELMKRYESATHVQRSSKDPHKLRPVRRGVRRPKRKDLVYIVESPDYCRADSRLGVLGTQNRRCNSTSSGPDSCSLLCCGRGYQVVLEEIEEDCNCKFVWCCQVRCDRCKIQNSNDICN